MIGAPVEWEVVGMPASDLSQTVNGRASGLVIDQPLRHVQQLLRDVGETDAGRLESMRTLATCDVELIWQNTGRRTAARDRLTHGIAGSELQRRGLL